MNIPAWIGRQGCQVPAEFRPRLLANGPVSPDALLAAAEREVACCAAGDPGDREAAFSLLAADAYVTYACQLALEDGADASRLMEMAQRVAQGWWRGM